MAAERIKNLGSNTQFDTKLPRDFKLTTILIKLKVNKILLAKSQFISIHTYLDIMRGQTYFIGKQNTTIN